MAPWNNLPIYIALPLALVAALMSGDGQARRDISYFVAEALKPQAIDMGSDVGYFLDETNQSIWPLPDRPQPFNQ
jgi:hypothetical protein